MLTLNHRRTLGYFGTIMPRKAACDGSLQYVTTISKKMCNKTAVIKAEGSSRAESIQKLMSLSQLMSTENASFTSAELSKFTESNHTVIISKNIEIHINETYYSADVYEHNSLKERITDTSVEKVITRLYTFLGMMKTEELESKDAQ
mgnify:CR=1 FL=1